MEICRQIFCCLLALSFCLTSADKIIRREKKLHPKYFVEWEVNFDKKMIQIGITAETKGFVGFGLSYTGGMDKADIILAGVADDGTSYISDRHGKGTQLPIVDKIQNWNLLSAVENTTHTILTIERQLETCDEEDIPITDDTLKIIWSLGATDEFKYHGDMRGSLHVRFLDPPSPREDLSQYQKWVTAEPVTLSGNDTTYWCTFFKAPVKSKKHHVVGFDIFMNGSNALKHTHHADLYRCKPPEGKTAEEYFSKYLGYGFDCYFATEFFPVEDCQLFELQWSLGGKLTMFPENLGLPIGEGSEYEYFMTEIHYNNPNKIENVEIHSGMEMYYTEDLRPIDAGFLQVGSMTAKYYSLTIPPNSENYVFSSHCPGQCTDNIPQEGINVFIYLLHSHLSGRQQKIRHFRDGVELPYIANDEHYDFNYQNNRVLKEEVKILPGDHITLECTYDTRWKKYGNVTLGGRSPREEMCQTFLMYYPRFLDVNLCGSYFPQQKMLDFMGVQSVSSQRGIFDPTITLPESFAGRPYSSVVESLNWTAEMRSEFQNLTRFGLQQAYCFPKHSEEHKKGTYGLVTYPEFNEEYRKESRCSRNANGRPEMQVGSGSSRTGSLINDTLQFIFNCLLKYANFDCIYRFF